MFQWIIKSVERARPEAVNINSNEPLFYLYSIKINNWCGSCNDIDYL